MNSTLGFLPAEIFYGRQICGPLYVVRKVWESPDGPLIEGKRDVVEYMENLKAMLKEVSEASKVNAERAQAEYNRIYDLKSTKRSLSIGEKVLILMPTSNSKMLAQFIGPYPVSR